MEQTLTLGGIPFNVPMDQYDPFSWTKRASVSQGAGGSVVIQDMGVIPRDCHVVLSSGTSCLMDSDTVLSMFGLWNQQGVTFSLVDYLGNNFDVFFWRFHPKLAFADRWRYEMTLVVTKINTILGGTIPGITPPPPPPPPTLNHFDFAFIPSPSQETFDVTITARSASGELVSSFASTVDLEATSGDPVIVVIDGVDSGSTTPTFSAGVWTGTIRIDTAVEISAVAIQALIGAVLLGTSNMFQYFPEPPIIPPMPAFLVITAPFSYNEGVAGPYMPIQITAKADDGSGFDAYSGTVVLSMLPVFGTVTGLFTQDMTPRPTLETTNFVNGFWSGFITLTTATGLTQDIALHCVDEVNAVAGNSITIHYIVP